ncbi:hypothetical protein HanPSC8_Chr17g0776131 [Helianthus annuus]|nr:hypothetical protein HanPSC8_Chr17g0776131 [Helianthus annuus]
MFLGCKGRQYGHHFAFGDSFHRLVKHTVVIELGCLSRREGEKSVNSHRRWRRVMEERERREEPIKVGEGREKSGV